MLYKSKCPGCEEKIALSFEASLFKYNILCVEIASDRKWSGAKFQGIVVFLSDQFHPIYCLLPNRSKTVCKKRHSGGCLINSKMLRLNWPERKIYFANCNAFDCWIFMAVLPQWWCRFYFARYSYRSSSCQQFETLFRFFSMAPFMQIEQKKAKSADKKISPVSECGNQRNHINYGDKWEETSRQRLNWLIFSALFVVLRLFDFSLFASQTNIFYREALQIFRIQFHFVGWMWFCLEMKRCSGQLNLTTAKYSFHSHRHLALGSDVVLKLILTN
jgi:hypothetical protein